MKLTPEQRQANAQELKRKCLEDKTVQIKSLGGMLLDKEVGGGGHRGCGSRQKVRKSFSGIHAQGR